LFPRCLVVDEDHRVALANPRPVLSRRDCQLLTYSNSFSVLQPDFLRERALFVFWLIFSSDQPSLFSFSRSFPRLLRLCFPLLLVYSALALCRWPMDSVSRVSGVPLRRAQLVQWTQLYGAL